MGRKPKDPMEQLRKEAETRLARGPQDYLKSLQEEASEDISKILYDLRSHQIELQIQNEELQETYIQLEHARDNYYHLYNFAPVSYLTISKDTRIEEANQTSLELFGTRGANLTGQFLSSYVADDDLASFHGALRDIFLLMQKKAFDVRLKKKGGSFIHVRMDGSLAGDNPDKCRLVLTDITELKRTQEELRLLNQALERRVHERTAQIGELSTQLCRAEQKERKRLSLMLHDHLQQLLVASRFSLCRLERGMEEDEFQRLRAQTEKMLNEAIQSSRSLAVELSPPVLYDAGLVAALEWLTRWAKDNYKLTVHLKVSKQGTEAAEEMNMFLFQAVKELLLNAVKHSGVSEALITLSSYDRDSFCIQVEDRGAGFDPAAILAEEKPGIGIRHTARRLEMMGGRLEIESAPGEGTCFRLIAPVRKSGEPSSLLVKYAEEILKNPRPVQEKKEREQAARRGVIRTLVADDHAMMRQGLVGLLRTSKDIEVVGEASDGLEVIQLARDTRPDVIIMDINMPKVNGIEATRLIKEEMPGIRVLVLSLHSKEDMAAASVLAGASAFVSKSDPSEKLVEVIRKAAG